MDIRDALIYLRKSLNKTQKQFAKELNITPEFLCRVETGTDNPPWNLLNKIEETTGYQLICVFVKTNQIPVVKEVIPTQPVITRGGWRDKLGVNKT